MTIDHITPLSRGGTDALSNRQPAHHRCNEWKADRTMREIIGAACSLETGAELQTILVQLYREDYEAMMRFYPDSTPEMAAWRCIRARVSGSQQPGDTDT